MKCGEKQKSFVLILLSNIIKSHYWLIANVHTYYRLHL